MKRSMLIITGLLAVALVLYVNANSVNKDGYDVGDYVADFELKDTNGEKVSLASYEKARGFIVIFTCNTCPYAKDYEQRIIELDEQFRDKGFPVIAINPNDVSQKPGDSMEEMKKQASKMEYGFPYVRDDSQQVARAFGATKTPHVYVLNKEAEGKYKVEFVGAIDNDPQDIKPEEDVETFVANAVNALLNGEKPTVTRKDAIGCTIKWKKS